MRLARTHVRCEVVDEHGFEELGRRVPDKTAIRKLTGWRRTRSVDEAIDDVIAFERARDLMHAYPGNGRPPDIDRDRAAQSRDRGAHIGG
jgi:hypothetical protein